MSYRASNTGPSPYYQQLIHDLRNGQTSGQKRRAFNDKVGWTVLQAGIGALGHTIEAGESTKLQGEQSKRDVMRQAIANATKQDAAMRSAPRVPNAPPKEDFTSDEYGLSQAPLAKAQALPSYADQMDGAVKASQANQKLNSAAAGASIGGVRPPGGLDDTHNDSELRAGDIMTGQSIMKDAGAGGGMQQSLRRTIR